MGIKGKEIYEDDYLKEVLIDKSKELGRPPKRREVLHGAIIAKRIGNGSWCKALEVVGLQPTVPKSYTKQQLTQILTDWYEVHKTYPEVNDFNTNQDLPDTTTYVKKFGMSWSNVVKNILGLELINYHIYSYTEDEALSLFREEYCRISPISKEDFTTRKSRDIPSMEYYFRKFNVPWNKLKRLAGIDDIVCIRRTEEEWINAIKKVIDELGYIPSTEKFEEYFDHNSFRPYLGSYNEALIKAGFTPPNLSPIDVPETKEELLTKYIEFSKKLDRLAGINDLKFNNEIYNYDVFNLRFGSINNLKKEANKVLDFPYVEQDLRKFSKTDIANKLKEEYFKLGRKPTNKEIGGSPDLPAVRTILSYFLTTSMETVWSEIGMSIV